MHDKPGVLKIARPFRQDFVARLRQKPVQFGITTRPLIQITKDKGSTRRAMASSPASIASKPSAETSSRTTFFPAEMQCLRNSISVPLDKLPPDLKEGLEYAILRRFSERKVCDLIQLIYRAKAYEGDSKDHEFSRQSMEDHSPAITTPFVHCNIPKC